MKLMSSPEGQAKSISQLFRESPVSIKTVVSLVMGSIAFLLCFYYTMIMYGAKALARLKVEVSASEYASRAQLVYWFIWGKITPIMLCILAIQLVLIYHILRGRNWSRVFVFSCFALTVCQLLFGHVYKGDLFVLACISGVFLLGTALLFCKGANQWFGSFPHGLSYWPLILVIVRIPFLLF